MFKHNPFYLIYNSLVNLAQRFVLHMLDNYNILVAFWSLLSAILIVATGFYISHYSSTTLSENLFDYSLAIFGTFILVGPATLQYALEKGKRYKEYQVLQLVFREDPTVKYFVIISMFIFTYLDVLSYFKNNDSYMLTVKLMHEPFFFMFYVFMSCYTRDREPPFKTNLSFNAG